ncbi:hypothetical protein BC936DRAFT_146811 [Jimgerdemannia flammicorona]|uniref:Uncharacterized protein n=1 Tax=Jimgerdemannia flammicorona TaxID=994334 RepID=A0A433D6U6_9FUNG|nr:hypothetical protein BC936DRAFT_146811 [Jimgerdemannia flammicorona]
MGQLRREMLEALWKEIGKFYHSSLLLTPNYVFQMAEPGWAMAGPWLATGSTLVGQMAEHLFHLLVRNPNPGWPHPPPSLQQGDRQICTDIIGGNLTITLGLYMSQPLKILSKGGKHITDQDMIRWANGAIGGDGEAGRMTKFKVSS